MQDAGQSWKSRRSNFGDFSEPLRIELRIVEHDGPATDWITLDGDEGGDVWSPMLHPEDGHKARVRAEVVVYNDDGEVIARESTDP